MIRSMTGYGRGTYQDQAYKITVEVRTLNSRYLEIHIKLPQDMPDLELAAKRYVKQEIFRGRVDVSCTIETNRVENIELNTQLIARYIEIFNRIKSEFNLAGELSVGTIAQLPGVIGMKVDQLDYDAESFAASFNRALADAISSVNRMRSEEGEAIKRDLVGRLRSIESALSAIEGEAGSLLEYYRHKLLQRMKDLTENLQIDEARLVQEAAFYAQRSDISEEVVRLRSHLARFYDLLERGVEVGKRLDFLSQEMNREINTILSKAGNVAIAEHGVAIKAEIEKLREQIQNIE